MRADLCVVAFSVLFFYTSNSKRPFNFVARFSLIPLVTVLMAVPKLKTASGCMRVHSM